MATMKAVRLKPALKKIVLEQFFFNIFTQTYKKYTQLLFKLARLNAAARNTKAKN
jgi:hypothetical protein